MTAPTSSTEILVTAPGGRVPIPRWARGFSAHSATEAEARKLSKLPGLTVVRLTSPQQAFKNASLLTHLGRLQFHADRPSRLVLMFPPRAKLDGPQTLTRLLGLFPRDSLVDVALQDPDRPPLPVLRALAGIQLEEESHVPEQDVLGLDETIAAATRDLHAPSGRLSARRIAETFGVSVAEIARISGVSRQAISKTEDSPAAQDALRSLERIARLRARLEDDDFRRWLRTPRWELDDTAPLGAIQKGQREAIADWVENLLVGNPA